MQATLLHLHPNKLSHDPCYRHACHHPPRLATPFLSSSTHDIGSVALTLASTFAFLIHFVLQSKAPQLGWLLCHCYPQP
jgi:hypothetical protein